MNNLHLLNNKSKKNNSKGFYIALGVCLIAIGVAAWTTYDSVVNYASPSRNSASSAPAAQTNQTVSGIKVIASEPKSSSSEASSQSVSSAKPTNTKPEPSAPQSAPSRKPASQPSRPAAAQVLTFKYPVGSTVAQKFSGENPVYSKTMQDWRVHTGVDISAQQGDTVKASADGTVKDVLSDDSYGNMVVISHGSIDAYYCGLGQTSVKKGDTVKQGQQIGTLGMVPCESMEAPHLHLSMKKNGKSL